MRAIVIVPRDVRLHPGACVTVKLWALKGTRIQGKPMTAVHLEVVSMKEERKNLPA